LLFKSLEFKNAYGQKVKIIDIPVLEDDSIYQFMIHHHLQKYIAKVYHSYNAKKVYSFRDYLKKVLKWPIYEHIYKSDVLKNNA